MNPWPNCIKFVLELVESLKTKAMPEKQLLRVSVPNDFEAAVELTLPIDFDINAKRKYPLLVYSYGGPGKIIID